jgi:hypothetical protein
MSLYPNNSFHGSKPYFFATYNSPLLSFKTGIKKYTSGRRG